jgi:hypothetical protein
VDEQGRLQVDEPLPFSAAEVEIVIKRLAAAER